MKTKEEFCNNIKQYEKAMYTLAYSIVRNEQDAGDVIGESILLAYCRLDSLKNDQAFKSWILRIVHNTAIEFIRKNTPTVDIQEYQNIADDFTESKLTTKLALREAVESLNQPYRTVIALYYYESLSVARIAKVTGTSAVTVRQQLLRARRQLREMLKEDFLYE